MQGNDATANRPSKTPRAYLEWKAVSCLTSWTSLCLLLQRGWALQKQRHCVENTQAPDLSVTGKSSTDDLYGERNVGPNPTVNHSQYRLLALNYTHFWETHELQIALLLLKSPAVTGPSSDAHNHLSVLSPLPLGTRLEPAPHFHKANTPLRGDKQKGLNRISVSMFLLEYCSLAERKDCFNLLQLLRCWCFCLNLY